MSDKRNVSTDALETLGTIIGPDEKRDAIHLAVIPAKAAETLPPGFHVGLVLGEAKGHGCKPIGIVDPFLEEPVIKGEWFWLVIYPRQITSLRHVWTHPGIPDDPADVAAPIPSSREASEAWLKNYLANHSNAPSYHTFLAAVQDNTDDSTLYISGEDAGGDISPEVWEHVEVVLGYRITDRPTWFSCSC